MKTCKMGLHKYEPAFYRSGKSKGCKECSRSNVRARRLANPEKFRAYDKKRYSNFEYLRNRNLKREFNITLLEYNVMLNKQSSVCAICKNSETSKQGNGVVNSLSVDHCHKTNKIRGLLCNNCNRSIGLLKDNISILKSAIDYLEASKYR